MSERPRPMITIGVDSTHHTPLPIPLAVDGEILPPLSKGGRAPAMYTPS